MLQAEAEHTATCTGIRDTIVSTRAALPDLLAPLAASMRKIVPTAKLPNKAMYKCYSKQYTPVNGTKMSAAKANCKGACSVR